MHAVPARWRGRFQRQVSLRGDTVDVFPGRVGRASKLFDDEVEACNCSTRSPAGCCEHSALCGLLATTRRATWVLGAVENHQEELRERLVFCQEGKLVEAQRLEQRTRFDLEMLSEVGPLQGHRELFAHLSGAQPGEPAEHAHRLPAAGCADVPG